MSGMDAGTTGSAGTGLLINSYEELATLKISENAKPGEHQAAFA